jgi:hypothetical protein
MEKELSWRDLANALEKHKPNVSRMMSLAELTYITRDLNALLTALAEKPAERPTWESTHCPYCGVNIADLPKDESVVKHLSGKCRAERPARNLTEHQKAVEEAAGMPIDWSMASGYEAGGERRGGR